jgi:hypothetical protein
MNEEKDKDTNLVKSDIKDQIEINNDKAKEDINPEFISIDISCDSCKYNPKNTTKKEQFLNLFGVNTGEEFYIKSEKDKGSYLIYHFTEQLMLVARSSNDKEGIMNWYSPSIGSLLEDDVELIKLQ